MRLAISLLLLMLIGLFVNCGKKSSHSSKKAGLTKDGKILITIWQTYNDEEVAFFDQLIAEYERENVHIKIKHQRIPFWGSEPKILTALATRTTPDIARLDVSFVAKLGLRNALIDLGPLGMNEIAADYLPAALGSCKIKKSWFAIPEQVNGLCLFYDKDQFIKAGLNPENPPLTWEEFIEYGKKLTAPDRSHWGFGMRNSLWWSFPFFYTFGAEFLSDPTPDGHRICLLDQPEAIQAFQFKYDLYHKYKIEGGAWRSGGIRDDTGFPNVYAMVFSGPWAVRSYREQKINFGICKIPAGPAGSSTTVGGQNMVIFRTCQHPQETFDLLRWLTSVEIQARWCNELGQIPVNYKAYPLIDKEKNPEISIFMEQMKTAIPRPQILNYDHIENLFLREMEAALTGSKSVEQAMQDACRRANEEYLNEE
ncbi:MAG: hypothetical protein B6244_10150 [Candidatus Cloacimonetes bacterium 4572_55]|nr:MAG: hypothetical protein B6244_10150 [Candidatus Cloacimonetes bacterium 4572_55]